MTDMDYEQKYKDALEAARSIYKDMKEGFNYSGMEDLEVIFPELAESEDERIRKTLVSFFIWLKTCDCKSEWNQLKVDDILTYLKKQKESLHVPETCKENSDSFTDDERIRKAIFKALSKKEARDILLAEGVQVSDALAFLEKQKEQTSSIPWVKSDNVTNPDKPYIDKAGWFYTTDGRMCPASEIEKQKEEEGYEAIPVESTLEYKLGFKAGKESEKRKGQEPVEESIRTKIISRAKSEKQVVLISETNDNAEIGWDTRSLRDTKNLLEYGLAFINKQLEQKPVEEQESVTDEILAKHIKAEFEGFRNLLKKKGIDYEPQQVYWDDFARLFVSSARKYVEQKPVDENQIDMNELKWQLEYWFGQVLCHYENKGCPYDDMGEVVRHFVEDASERIAKKIMRPVEWSEKDEVAMRITMDWLIEYRDRHANLEETKDEIDHCIDWLKSLRPQPKQEWSEEDEKMISKITDVITGYHPMRSTKENEEMIAFLKSLRPQQKTEGIMGKSKEISSNWKPSEEQMEALNALNLHGDLSYVGQQNQLISLYQDLKKLM